MITIQRFCERHGACREGREWAMRECNDMHDVWAKAKPEWLVWVATRPGVLSDSDLRLFACWCARQVWHLLDDERSRVAVVVAERYAKGEVSDEELTAAREAAREALWEAVWAAAEAAARAAARVAARATAEDAARVAARATAWQASLAAAEDAAWAASRDAARATAWAAARAASRAAALTAVWATSRAAAEDAQAEYVRKLTPNFG